MDDSSERDWKMIENEITCRQCNDLFTEPKTISCLHTFCEKCIVSVANNQRGICPVRMCQAKLPQDVAAIPTNAFLKRMVDIFRKRKAAISGETAGCRKCGTCVGNGPAVMWCVTCVNYLCKDCNTSHERMLQFKLHKTLAINQFVLQSPTSILAAIPQPTDQHGQPLDLYCKACHVFICKECATVKHRQHHYGLVNAVADEERDKIKMADANLKALLQQIKAAKEELEVVDNDMNNETDAEMQIRDLYRKLYEILQEEEAKVVTKVKDIKSSCHHSLCDQKGDISCLESLVLDCDKFISKVTTNREREIVNY